MLLPAVSPVDHTETGHAQGSTVHINGNGVRDGIRAPSVAVEVNKRSDLPFLTKPIGGIVVMCGVQADVSERDIRIDGFKFPEGNDGTDTVVPPGIQETDMEWEVKANLRIMGAEHVKGGAKIKDFLIAVPSPVCVRVREMASAGAMGDAAFHTFTDLMSKRGSMGMDTSAVAGKSEAVFE